MSKILVLGATSSIAHATSRLFAADGDKLFLVAREPAKLEAVAADLRVRGASLVETGILDAFEYERHEEIIGNADNTLGGLDIALIAHGSLPDQKACEGSFDLAKREFELNCVTVISMLTHLANYFERKKSGSILVITSVAGDRGRQSNYVYGAAKAALNTWLEGLRNRLHPAGVQVLTIKPGFVDTPMTGDFRKGLLWVQPGTVAKDIYQSCIHHRDVIYTPRFWRLIMGVIKLLPGFIFKRMKL